jgi:hypothetical protein
LSSLCHERLDPFDDDTRTTTSLALPRKHARPEA